MSRASITKAHNKIQELSWEPTFVEPSGLAVVWNVWQYHQATGDYRFLLEYGTELRDLGWQAEVVDLGEGFPVPDAGARAAAQDLSARRDT